MFLSIGFVKSTLTPASYSLSLTFYSIYYSTAVYCGMTNSSLCHVQHVCFLCRFSETAHQISVKRKQVEGRALGLRGRQARWKTRSVCVVFADRPSAIGSLCISSPPPFVLPQKPAGQMWDHSLGNPRIPPPLTTEICTHAKQPPLSFDITHTAQPGSKQLLAVELKGGLNLFYF